MCQDLNATCYINPINGRHLYTSDFCSESDAVFEMDAVEYPQMGWSLFLICMIDVLMMNGRC